MESPFLTIKGTGLRTFYIILGIFVRDVTKCKMPEWERKHSTQCVLFVELFFGKINSELAYNGIFIKDFIHPTNTHNNIFPL